MVQVAKLIVITNAVHNVCKEAIFRFPISSFITQLIKWIRSATELTLFEMKS